MYSDLILGFLFLIFALLFAKRAIYYWLTDIDELYSDYRNSTDFGYPYFRRLLAMKRFFYAFLLLLFIALGVFFIS